MSDLRSDGYLTDLPYLPTYQPTQSPLAIRYAALVNGVIPPRTASGFRYIELGCGTGRSLCTLAAANPQGQFVGVDLLAEHTRAAGREIEAGELRNAQVVTAGFDAVPEELGRFDFITFHGVWSWVGPRVRAQILAFAERRLAEGGLLLLSYNTMPGWSHLLPSHRATFGVVTATAAGPIYERVLARLGEAGSLRLSDLQGDPVLARRGAAELVADLDIGVAMGLFEVSAQPMAPRARPPVEPAARAGLPPRGPQPPPPPRGGVGRRPGGAVLPRHGERRAADRPRGRPPRRAGARGPGRPGRSGGGPPVGHRALQLEGRPVTEASARRSLLQQTCQTFEEEGLARLARLGILTAG